MPCLSMIQHNLNLLEQFLRQSLLVYHRFPTCSLGSMLASLKPSGMRRYGPSTCGHLVAAACLSHEGTATFVIVSCQSSKTGFLTCILGQDHTETLERKKKKTWQQQVHPVLKVHQAKARAVIMVLCKML